MKNSNREAIFPGFHVAKLFSTLDSCGVRRIEHTVNIKINNSKISPEHTKRDIE